MLNTSPNLSGGGILKIPGDCLRNISFPRFPFYGPGSCNDFFLKISEMWPGQDALFLLSLFRALCSQN